MHSPLDSYFPPAVRFLACLALALLTHLVIYIAINDVKLPHIEEKTVLPSVRLISAQQSTSSTSEAASSKENSVVSTTSQSKNKTSITNQSNQRTSTNNKSKSTRQKTERNTAQTKRQNRARNSLQELFTQSRSDRSSPSSQKQISTKQAPLLSEYEQKLIKHMVKPALYDRFHQASRNEDSLRYDIQLVLFANGAIRSARIKRSSGIKEIDDLAVTAAYNASPFPRPPHEDQSKGFSYRIPVEYVP